MALGLAAILAAAAPLPAAEIRFVTTGDRTVVEAHGLDPELLAGLASQPPAAVEWDDLFALYTEDASLSDGRLPPLLGSYEIEPWGVRFTPRFELVAGQTYVARLTGAGSPSGEIHARLTLPRPDTPPSTILAEVYPSGSEVPENLLRIYLQFSAPMSHGHAHLHIRLLDDAGDPVEGPFVAPERELWSPDGSRLTLFLDPGRIKRGVGPNAEVGPPLRAGGRYRLVVDRQLADARGVPLARGHTRVLEVLEPDRDQPRIEDWTLEPPATRADPVRLRFPEPLDHGLLEGLLTVLDARGAPVAGSVAVSDGETRWSFRPELGWGDVVYRIRVGTLLEDLAGNSLRRPFEVATAGGGSDASEEAALYLDLPFSAGEP